jgi:hypothetical protein
MARPGGPGHVRGIRDLLSQGALIGPSSSLPHLNCGGELKVPSVCANVKTLSVCSAQTPDTMTGSGCGAGRDRLYGRRAAGRHVEVTRCGDWAAGSQQAHRGGSISRVRGARVAGHDCERTLRVLTCAQIWIQSQVRIQVSLVAETDGQTLTGGHMAAAVPPGSGASSACRRTAQPSWRPGRHPATEPGDSAFLRPGAAQGAR